MSAPNVLTQECLTQRSAQPMVMIQSEEILKTRTPAYSATNSDISFLVRQPSASAILKNSPELYLELQFTTSDAPDCKSSFNGAQTGVEDANRYDAIDEAQTDYGFMPEMLPLQNKCIRNMVITINGASQSVRCNEFGKPYCLMHCSREYMEKIGGGINDYKKSSLWALADASGSPLQVQNASDALQYKRWKNQMLQDKTLVRQQHATGNDRAVFTFREPLYSGVFGAFSNSESFPAWSCEQRKSAGLLHCHNLQLQCAMEENWWRSLYLQTKCYAKTGAMASVTGVTINKAELLCEWVQPPPRLVGSAIGQQIAYATTDVLRFVADWKENSPILHSSQSGVFGLNAVSFPYMPNIFVFEIAPHYAHKSEYIGMRTTQYGGAYGALESMKKDARCCITHMNLIVNTSNQAVPFKGSTDVQSVRINAYDLYKMTLENCFSIERFPYSFDEWLEAGCFVAITPAQLNGVLNSPSIRGNVVLQGEIYVKNCMPQPVNCGKATQVWTAAWASAGVIYENGGQMERVQCVVSGIYSNRQLVLDSKSGLVSQNTFSQAFGQSLRLGSAQ